MAWANILDIPGLEYTLRYRAGTSDVVPSGPAEATIAGGEFVFDSNYEWSALAVEITNFGSGVVPMDARIVATNIYSEPSAEPYGAGAGFSDTVPNGGSTGGHAVPYSGETLGAMDDTTRFAYVGVGYPTIISGSFKVELDGEFAEPDFWTDNVACFETDGLIKPPLRTIDPGVPPTPEQPAIPPTHECYDLPDPPGGGGIGGGGGGGGDDNGDGGSGTNTPPEDVVLCFSGTHGGEWVPSVHGVCPPGYLPGHRP